MKMLVVLLLVLSKLTNRTMTMIAMKMVVTMNVICGHHNKEVKGNNTARLKMRMLVVLLMVLSKVTTMTMTMIAMMMMVVTMNVICGHHNKEVKVIIPPD